MDEGAVTDHADSVTRESCVIQGINLSCVSSLAHHPQWHAQLKLPPHFTLHIPVLLIDSAPLYAPLSLW